MRRLGVVAVVLGGLLGVPAAGDASPNPGAAVPATEAARPDVVRLAQQTRARLRARSRARANAVGVRSGSKSSLSDYEKEYMRERIIDQQRSSTSREGLR